MPFLAHAFIDGKNLRKVAETAGLPPPDSQAIVKNIFTSPKFNAGVPINTQ